MITTYQVNAWPSYRIKHARLRHKQLLNQVELYANSKPFRISTAHGTANERVQSVIESFTPPDVAKMSVYVGEIANALRGALDSTVWQILNAGQNRNDGSNLQFPILDDPDSWEAKAKSWLAGAQLPLLDRVKFCQPFSLKTGYPEHPLNILRMLSNLDKHKTSIALRGTAAPGADINVEYAGPVKAHQFGAWLQAPSNFTASPEPAVGAIVFDAVVPSYVSNLSVTGHVDFHLAIDLDGLPELPFVEIPRIIDYVEQVIWYVQAGEEAQELYLRNPMAYTSGVTEQ
ncbi:hypothetical protein [Leucobacter triazinivorans]|uniref:Uncharacterized protein n=1 Tax=Leucobacter triazinivorans TaxID=1784719 RepID=A0A4P6KJ57_9MICO|nr:hypothetical protein [Leucobacter triazinivorans]QBE49634.1 hypothetical protein EVS81_13035 [Leucobacter triazinivorans]